MGQLIQQAQQQAQQIASSSSQSIKVLDAQQLGQQINGITQKLDGYIQQIISQLNSAQTDFFQQLKTELNQIQSTLASGQFPPVQAIDDATSSVQQFIQSLPQNLSQYPSLIQQAIQQVFDALKQFFQQQQANANSIVSSIQSGK